MDEREHTGSIVRVLWLRPTKPDNISVGRERIAARLRDRGYEIDIQDSSGLDSIRAVWRAVTGEYDVLIGTVRMGLYVGFILKLLLRLPLIADVTDPIEQIDQLPAPIFRILSEYEYFTLEHADSSMFIYQSSYDAAKNRGISGEKIENGVDFDNFNNPDEEDIKTAYSELENADVDPESPIVVYIGGLTPRYHIEEILNAADTVSNAEFVFIGDGELRSKVTSGAEKQDNVYFLGTYDHELIPGFLAHADIGLCLVDAEQPLKVLEYGAAGLPVIASYGELQNRFTDDELMFVDPADELATAISELIQHPERRDSYASHLQEQSKSSDWGKIAMEYEQALKRICE